jgi:hypothetical protein
MLLVQGARWKLHRPSHDGTCSPPPAAGKHGEFRREALSVVSVEVMRRQGLAGGGGGEAGF